MDTGKSAQRGAELSAGITASDFIDDKVPAVGTDCHKAWRNADGTINTNGVGIISSASQYASFSTDGDLIGARFFANNNTTLTQVSIDSSQVEIPEEEVEIPVGSEETAQKLTIIGTSTFDKTKEGGTVSGGGEIAKGGNTNILAKANDGYIFSKWIDNDSHDEHTNGASISLNIQSDRDFTAVFEPVIIKDTTMMPLRFITENLGGSIVWDQKTQEITLNIDGTELKMQVGVEIEGYDISPVIQNGRTLVPLRYISEAIGANVTWVPSTKAIEIVR